MDNNISKPAVFSNPIVLQNEDLLKYILEISVYPQELETLRELRNATASPPTPANEGSFDADKNNYWNYHERLIKLVKIGGIVAYDNTLWGGTVALPEKAVPEPKREWRQCTLAFNKAITKDSRVEIAFVSIGDGIIVCRRHG